MHYTKVKREYNTVFILRLICIQQATGNTILYPTIFTVHGEAFP